MKASEVQSLETAAAQASSLLAALDRSGTAAADVGLTLEDVEHLKRFASLQNPLTIALRQMGDGKIQRSEVEPLFARAQVEGRMLQPMILRMLVACAGVPEDNAPFNVGILKFLAKGFGMVSPAKPVDSGQRAKQAKTAAELTAMPTEQVLDAVLESVADTKENKS